jgi:hypothetical protein
MAREAKPPISLRTRANTRSVINRVFLCVLCVSRSLLPPGGKLFADYRCPTFPRLGGSPESGTGLGFRSVY